jgi:hypothetical protein
VDDVAGDGSGAEALECDGGGAEGAWGYWGGVGEVFDAAVGLFSIDE